MKHRYQCKFCGRPGEVEYEPVPEFKLAIEKWLQIICCDRCGRFYEAKRGVQHRLFANCMAVLQIRQSANKPKDADKVIAAARTRISNRCNEFAELVCDYLKIQTVNDPSFSEILMEKPHMVSIICHKYFSGLRRQFKPEPSLPYKD